MSASLTLLATVAALYAAGVYLLLERSLTRVLLGVLLLGNATNLLVLSSGGAAGGPPITGQGGDGGTSDPLPQAMVLTAIVITLGIAAFVLALIHRSWLLDRAEDVVDDVEDVRLQAGTVDQESEVDPHESGWDSGDDTDQPTVPRPTVARQ